MDAPGSHQGKDQARSSFVLLPISRPNRILRILGARPGLEKGSAFTLCLLCFAGRPCSHCVCFRAQRGEPQEFVDACEKPELTQGVLGLSQGFASGVLLCRFCTAGAQYTLLQTPDESAVLAVQFAHQGRALGFYNRHKHLLVMDFPKSRIEFFEDTTRTQCTEKRNIRLEVLQKAFGAPVVSSRASGFEDAGCAQPEEPEKADPAPETMDVIVYLASGRHTNVLLQEKLRALSQDELLRVLYRISAASFFFLSKHKYGTYVIQLLISIAKSDALISEIKEMLAPYGSALLRHGIGNYVVQHMLVYDTRFVLECFLRDFERILGCKIGMRAFKSCAQKFRPYRTEILPRIGALLLAITQKEELKVLRSAIKDLTLPPPKPRTQITTSSRHVQPNA